MAKRKRAIQADYRNPYKMTSSQTQRLSKAVEEYNKAVKSARKMAGFDDYELDGLAMPTTFANVKRRIKDKRQLDRVIKNLEEYTKPSGTKLVYKVDKETGEVTDIRFSAQIKQLNRAVAAENKLREQVRFAAKGTDTRIYNPNIDVDIKDVGREEIEKRRGTSPIDLGTTTSIINARTENWKNNYINALDRAVEQVQKEHGILQVDITRIRKLKNLIRNATINQVNYMIYNEKRGDIRSGPYAANVLLYLDQLEAEWVRATSNPWNIFGG